MVTRFLSQEWKAPAPEPDAWWLWLAELALVALVLAYAGLIVRALLRQRRYRATSVLGEGELRQVHAALAEAERRTLGEILPVVLERSDRHPGACWLAALVATLLGTAVLTPWLAWDRPEFVLAAQLLLGALGYASARFLSDFQRVFVGAARAREAAEEQAFQEFYRHALDRTEGRTGVLLFVSLLERHAIVMADEGIAARVPPETWARANEAILAGIRNGSLVAGLVAGIREAGTVLAEHFPVSGGDRNEIPDRVIVRTE